MSTVFLSYSRSDFNKLQQICEGLEKKGVQVWRDQESLYGGEHWPKRIGEAIARCDAVLLCWSATSAKSDWVEFEWNTGLALKKPIIPIFLDKTLLAASLSGFNGISLGDPFETVSFITRSLGKPTERAEPERAKLVIDELEGLNKKEVGEVRDAVKQMLNQQGWHVQGNIYQAAGDIHVTIQTAEQKPKKLLERWQAWVAFAIALLTLTGLMLDLPGKVQKLFLDREPGQIQVEYLPLSGIILDEAGEPIEGVIVRLTDVPGAPTDTTDRLGYFDFKVQAKGERQVTLMAQKEGLETIREDPTLGNTNLKFKLLRKR